MAIKGNLINPTGTHLSEKVFRAYESYLLDFLASFPRILTLTPKGIRPITFRATICNAINAHITHRYESSVDPNALAAAWQMSMATVVGDVVLLGPKAAIREQLAAQRNEIATIGTTNYLTTIDSPTLDQLNALAYLYATGVFNEPTKLTGALPSGFSELPNTALSSVADYWLLI